MTHLGKGSHPAAGSLAGGAHGRTGNAKAAWTGATDIVSLLAVIFALPFVILALGVPVVLVLNGVLWLARLL